MMGLFNTSKGKRGTGLGLYLSRNLIEMFGGTFDIDSEGVGKGSEVTIQLPAITK